ncbi:MAG: HPr kinase/phosphatase C-terminal domain-containing protein [Novosphingobium sp.]|nr:HPr kinase/phosphatase C-terminal domain-containing protein [Novosphingobium sp.]
MTTAHQATCVAIAGRAVLIEGAPGTGKSSLALALIDRGAMLVGDDSVMLEARGPALHACPHPQTRGLLEIRNLGLVEMPVCASAPVCLAITLTDTAPRYIERADTVERNGVFLPHVKLWPDPSLSALKVEIALRSFGMDGKQVSPRDNAP